MGWWGADTNRLLLLQSSHGRHFPFSFFFNIFVQKVVVPPSLLPGSHVWTKQDTRVGNLKKREGNRKKKEQKEGNERIICFGASIASRRLLTSLLEKFFISTCFRFSWDLVFAIVGQFIELFIWVCKCEANNVLKVTSVENNWKLHLILLLPKSNWDSKKWTTTCLFQLSTAW